MEKSTFEIYTPDMESSAEHSIASSGLSSGFPSPADDYMGLQLDLNRELVKSPASTFYARVSGNSMVEEGINDGDLLLIDKSIEPYDGVMAVCFIDGEFTLKRFADHGDYGMLISANENYQPIKVDDENDFMIWGVVRYVIKKMI